MEEWQVRTDWNMNNTQISMSRVVDSGCPSPPDYFDVVAGAYQGGSSSYCGYSSESD